MQMFIGYNLRGIMTSEIPLCEMPIMHCGSEAMLILTQQMKLIISIANYEMIYTEEKWL
jgi:hypothetical protein